MYQLGPLCRLMCGLRSLFRQMVSRYFDEKMEAVLPTLYHLHRGLAGLSTSSVSTPLFNALDRSGTNVEIHGKILYLTAIKDMVMRLNNEIADGIERLTFGLGALEVPEHVSESPREARADFGFIDHPSNIFHKERDMLLRYILSGRNPGVRMYSIDGDDQIVWLAGPCHEYLALADSVLKQLFVATHLTVGPPARGTEVTSQLIRNVAGGSFRNILFLFNIFLSMGTHNKTSHVTNEDKNIVRAPWPMLVPHWLTMLVRIRPLVVTLQLYFRGSRHGYRAEHYLYPGLQRPESTSDLSKAMSFHTSRILGVSITLKLWRQVVAWFVAENARLFERPHMHTTVAHLGFGHSSVINSRHYAGDARLPVELDKSIFFISLMNSATWHILLDLDDQLLRAMVVGDYNRNRVMHRIESVMNPSAANHLMCPGESDGDGKVSGIPLEHAARRLMYQMLPEINNTVNRAFSHSLSQFVATTLPLLRESSFIPPMPALVNPLCAAQLSEHLGRPSSFRSSQGLATQIMYENETSLLYITPTGTSQHFYITLIGI